MHVTARTRTWDSIPFGPVEESMDAINPDLLAVQSAIGTCNKVAIGATIAPWLAQGSSMHLSGGEVLRQFWEAQNPVPADSWGFESLRNRWIRPA